MEPKLLTEYEAQALWAGTFVHHAKPFADYLAELRERGLIAPEPVDPLLIEAREICSAAYRAASYTAYADEMARGGRDDTIIVHATLAALKRGMELQREASNG